MSNTSNPKKRDKDLAVFCANVRQLRQQEGLSKAAFARIMGVSVHTINRLEQNVLPARLRTSSVIRLAQHFEMTVSSLFRSL